MRSSITVITNVRYDHVFEMGDTLEEIAQSLSQRFRRAERCTRQTAAPPPCSVKMGKDCRLVLCPAESVAQENISHSQEVAASLGVTGEEFNRSLSAVQEDFGTRRIYRMKNRNGEVFHFLNLFSANDPQSTKNNGRRRGWLQQSVLSLQSQGKTGLTGRFFVCQIFFPHYKEHTVFPDRQRRIPSQTAFFSGAGLTDPQGNSRLQGLP